MCSMLEENVREKKHVTKIVLSWSLILANSSVSMAQKEIYGRWAVRVVHNSAMGCNSDWYSRICTWRMVRKRLSLSYCTVLLLWFLTETLGLPVWQVVLASKATNHTWVPQRPQQVKQASKLPQHRQKFKRELFRNFWGNSDPHPELAFHPAKVNHRPSHVQNSPKKRDFKNKPMLNPNSYAVTQAKTNGLCKLILLGTSEYLGPLLGTLEPFGTFTWNPYLESRNPLEPLRRTLTWNLRSFRNLTCTWNPLLEPWLGTLTWNLATSSTFTLEPGNLLEPLLGASKPSEPGTLSRLEPLLGIPWNLRTSWILDLQPLLGNSEPSRTLEPLNLAEPCGMTAPECPRPSLAEAPKLSVGEKTIQSWLCLIRRSSKPTSISQPPKSAGTCWSKGKWYQGYQPDTIHNAKIRPKLAVSMSKELAPCVQQALLLQQGGTCQNSPRTTWALDEEFPLHYLGVSNSWSAVGKAHMASCGKVELWAAPSFQLLSDSASVWGQSQRQKEVN